MKIAVGSNHRGYQAKQDTLKFLRKLGHEVEDFGCHGTTTIDYPDVAYPLAKAVASGQCDLGILIGANGMGMCMAANKVRGVRAAVVHNEFEARSTRERQHCNVLCVGVDLHGGDQLPAIIEGFLSALNASGHYARQVKKLAMIEQGDDPRGG